ncbi:hypothetical protein H8D85_00090 [bacterium]|nr:hypothetical protein [bacterium]
MAFSINVKFFNSFWMKKVVPKASGDTNPAVGSPATVNINWPESGNKLPLSVWPGLPWNPTDYITFPWNGAVVNEENNALIGEERQWYIEESVIRGGFNNTRASLGVRAYLAEDEEAVQQHRKSSLIYSGVYNSRTGINDTNVFSIAEDISKSLNPTHGSIQKLFAENTNLNIFQENKVSHALIDKDAVYSAEGSPMQTQSNVVIGQVLPYLGEYGISKNPESFAIYGFQKYFADSNRGIIGRLSRDGITEISNYGMTDYFRDALATINPNNPFVTLTYQTTIMPALNPSNVLNLSSVDCGCCNLEPGMLVVFPTNQTDINGDTVWKDTGAYILDVTDNTTYCSVTLNKFIDYTTFGLTGWPVNVKLQRYILDKIVGGWDIHNKCYTVSLQPTKVQNGCIDDVEYSTLNFDESINGWVSFYDYKPTMMCSLKNSFLSSDGFKLWRHYYYNATNTSRGFFYDQAHKPSSIQFVFNPSISIVKSFQTISYEGSNGWGVEKYESDPTEFNQSPVPIYPPTNPLTYTSNWQAYNDETQKVLSYEEGKYIDPADGLVYRAGFDRKENRYVSELKSATTAQAEEVIYWNGLISTAAPISGVKGYFVTVDLQTDDATDVGGLKELFAVSSNYVVSST